MKKKHSLYPLPDQENGSEEYNEDNDDEHDCESSNEASIAILEHSIQTQ